MRERSAQFLFDIFPSPSRTGDFQTELQSSVRSFGVSGEKGLAVKQTGRGTRSGPDSDLAVFVIAVIVK